MLTGSSVTASVSGAITGGNGGAAGAFVSTCCTYGNNGAGGTGIVASNLGLVLHATVSGGLNGNGVTRANALSFTGGANQIVLASGWGLVGGIDVASGASLEFVQGTNQTLSNVISGGGSIIKSSIGNLTLSGINTYSGGTTIYGGTLTADNPDALGSGAVTLFGTGTLAASNSIYLANAVKIADGGTINANGNTLTLSGDIQDVPGNSGTLTFINGAVILMGANNTYSGATIVGDGTVQAVLEGAFSANSAMTVNAASYINLYGADRTIASLAGAGGVQGAGSVLQTLTTGGNNSSTTFSGILSDGGGTLALKKAGTGTMTLSGVNSYTGGTTVNGGLINFAAGNNLGSGAITLDGGGLQWATGSTLDISGRLNAIGAGGGTFDTNGNNVTFASAISGFGITKAGTGTLTLSAANAYTGATSITGGTLKMGVNDAINPSSAVSVASGATFDLDGFDQSIGSLSGAGDVLLGSGDLTFGGDNSSTSFSGTLTGDGTNAVKKYGAGTFTLAGSMDLGASYDATGGTTYSLLQVNSGTVAVSSTGSVTADLIQNFSTITNEGTITAGSTLQTFGTLTNDGEIVGLTQNFATLTNNGTMGGLQSLTGTAVNNGTISGIVSNFGTFTNTSTGIINGALSNYGTALLDGELNGDLGNYLSGATVTLTGAVTGITSYYGTAGAVFDLDGYSTTIGSLAGTGEIKLGAGTLTVDTTSTTASFSGVISGGGTLAKAGIGTLTLTGVNTYGGGTTINGGLVNFAADNNLGSGNVTLDGGGLQWATGNTLDISGRLNAIGAGGGTFDTNGNNVTFASAISGGGITKAGTGTLTLNAANTYTGATSITGGTLKLGVNTAISSSSAVSVASGATFDIGAFTQQIGSLSGDGTVQFGNDGRLEIGYDNSSTSFGGTIVTTGNLATFTKSGSGTFTVTSSLDLGLSGNNSDTFIQVNAGTLNVASTGSVTADLIQNFGTIANEGTITAGTVLQTFGTLTNDGEISGGTQNFGTLTNNGTMGGLQSLTGTAVNNGTISGDITNFGTFTNASTGIINGSLSNFGTALLDGELNGGLYNSQSGATITLTGAVTGITYYRGTAGAVFDLDGYSTTIGDMSGTGEIRLGTGTLTVDTASTAASFGGVISGNGALVKDGTGTLTLSGVNTYDGGTTVAGGTLRLANSAAAGTGAITTTGSVIDYANGVDIANAIIVSSNTTQLQVSGSDTATQSGTILEDASARPLEKIGTGTLIVASATNTGTTTISAGTWKAANALAFSLYSDHVVAAGAVLDLNGNDQVISSLAGAGTVTSSAAGNITLAVGNFGAGNIGTIFSGVIEDGSGTVNVMVDGASGTFILAGANTYTGETTICDCSVLQIGNGGTTGSITSNVVNNNLLIFNRSDDYDFTYTISDGFGSPGSVQQSGSGVLTLSGVNSYSGETVASAGTLEIGNADAIGTSTLVLDGGIVRPGSSGLDLANDVAVNAAGGTISVSGGQDFTLSGTISDGSGAGVLTKTGAGTLILSGSNSYSGGTAVNGGVLAISDDSNLGDTGGALTLDGGTLRSDGLVALDAARDVNLGAGGGTLDINGNGIEVDGNIHGAGHLSIVGGGFTAGGGFFGGFSSAAVLFGLNDYTGGTTIDDTLAIALDSASLGDASGAITLQNQGGILFFGPTTLESTRTITLGAGGGGLAGFDSLQVDSRITGSGSLTLLSGADLTLTGINDYTGGTVLLGGGAGEFFIADDRNLGAANGALEMFGAILGFDADVTMASRPIALSGLGGVFDTDGHTVTIGQPVSGTGDLVQLGSGTLILAGDNTHVGDTYIDGGTLQLGTGGASGSLAADPGDIIFNGGTLVLNSSGTHTISQDITNFFDDGVVRQLGTGTTILTGTNDYSGGTRIDAGTLQIGDGGTTGSLGGGAVVNNGTLAFKRSDAVTMAEVISGTGILRQDGSGTLTLTAANTFTGGLTINTGTVALTGAGNIATLPLIANGTFNFAAMSGSGVTVTTLNGSGTVATGSKTLTILNGGSFSGTGTGTGAFILNGGIFSANGTLSNSITLGSGATLKGRGTVGGVSSGSGSMVAPGNSIGTLNVAGNVSFASGSTYQVEVDNSGASDRIAATGTATLSGGTVDVQAATGAYGFSTDYTILTATGGVTGQFAGATSNFVFLTPTLNYGANAVTLNLKQVRTFPSIAQTPNQLASATALQAGGAGGGALFASIFSSINDDDARAAFDAASGEIHATLLASQLEAASATRRVVLDRMRAGGANEAGWSVWGSITGNWGDMDGDGNAASAHRTGVSLTAGADTRLDDNWRGGFEGGFSSNKLTVAARNSAADVQSGHVGAYAFGSYDAIKLRAGGSYGFGTADTQRVVTFTGFNELATASQDADTLNLFGEAGYTFIFDGYAIEPFAGLSWTQVKAGAFRESGGSAALAGVSRTLSDGFVTLGAQASATPFAFAGVSLAPTVRAGWQHAFSNDLASRSLSFISTGQGFTVLGTPLDADRAVIDAGASLSLGDSVNLFLGYAGTLSSRATDNGVRLTGRVAL